MSLISNKHRAKRVSSVIFAQASTIYFRVEYSKSCLFMVAYLSVTARNKNHKRAKAHIIAVTLPFSVKITPYLTINLFISLIKAFHARRQDDLIMSLRSNVSNKKVSGLMIIMTTISVLFLNACNKNNSTFEGCYTVSHDEPAQIKISKLNGVWVMQMKEPARSNRIWDNPEPLEVMKNSDVPTFFSIDPDNVDAVIGRPDRVLVLAHVKPSYATMDPLLDSEYLSYIYRGANTIYRVECDDVNTDILANPHANIVIDNVNDSM